MVNMDSLQWGVARQSSWLWVAGLVVFLLGATLPLHAAENSELRTITVMGMGESSLDRAATGLIIVPPHAIEGEKLTKILGVPMEIHSMSNESVRYALKLGSDEVGPALDKLEDLTREFELTKAELIPGPMPENLKEKRYTALEKALFHAKEKAEVLARTYDMIVGEPLKITEKSVSTGSFTVVAEVEVVFDMR